MLTIKVNNLDVVLAKIKGLGAEVQSKLDSELNTFGLVTVAEAIKRAPVDEGHLRQSISFKKEKLKVTITVGVNYAAYIEFGTRRFAAAYVSSLPSDWQTFASGFKGKGGGSFEEMVIRLTEWVHRKGLGAGGPGQPIGVTGTYSIKSGRRTGNKKIQAEQDKSAAYAIARSIMIKGIRPHPFLFPAYQNNVQKLVDNIKAALK